MKCPYSIKEVSPVADSELANHVVVLEMIMVKSHSPQNMHITQIQTQLLISHQKKM